MGSASSTLNTEQLKSISLTSESAPKIIADFRTADAGKTGLTFDQFKSFFNQSIKNVDDATLQSIFNSFDSDGNGSIEFKEFASAVILLAKTDAKSKLEFIFDTFDDDNSGFLSADELKNITDVINTTSKIASGVANDRIEAVIAGMERTENGISKAEWVSKATADSALVASFN